MAEHIAAVSTVGVCAYASFRWGAAIVGNASRGLDASDESFYLASVLHPAAATGVVTEFGFYLAPLLAVAGGSLARFRVAGLVLLWLVSAAVATLLVPSWRATPRIRAAARVAVAALIGAVASTTYVLWLTTPGYNLLVVVATMAIAGALGSLAVELGGPADEGGDRRRREPVALATLVAVLVPGAGTKGPAFAVVGVLAIAAVAVVCDARRRWRRVLKWCGVGAIVGLIVHVALVGAPTADARRLSRGLAAYRRLGAYSRSTMWETEAFRSDYGPWLLAFAVAATLVTIVWRIERRAVVRAAASAIGAIASAAWLLRNAPGGGDRTFPSSAGWWWLRLAALTMLWLTASSPRRSRAVVAGPAIALMAVGATVGTNNGFVRQTALTAGVLAVGVLVHAVVLAARPSDPLDERPRRAGATPVRLVLAPVLSFFVVGGIVSVRLLDDAVRTPYRLGAPLAAATVPVNLDRLGTVRLTPAEAAYVVGLQALRPSIPAGARGCLVDLAGGTPLSSLALGMRPAGYPWILGAYPGSDATAAELLRDVACLRGEFVLIEAPGGERAVGRPAWLRTEGAVLVGSVRFDGYLHETQQVWLVPAAGS